VLSWFSRLRRDLARQGGEHDLFVRLVIVERLVKAALLIAGAITVVVLGHRGVLGAWATAAQNNLTWDGDASLIERLIDRALIKVSFYHHLTAVAAAIVLYALLEGTEGLGLALHRRWAEYLTVLATGLLIPYEAYEVAHGATLFKTGALILNVAVVGYLAWRKRLFVFESPE
jgi:uncharacterized membrane protein (DUF2068 family)